MSRPVTGRSKPVTRSGPCRRRRNECAARSDRPSPSLSGSCWKRPLHCQGNVACRRWGIADARAGAHPGSRGRVGLRQVDDRQARAGAGAAERGHGALPWTSHCPPSGRQPGGHCGAASRWSTRIRWAPSIAVCRSARRSKSHSPFTNKTTPAERRDRALAAMNNVGLQPHQYGPLSARTVRWPASARGAGACPDDRSPTCWCATSRYRRSMSPSRRRS